MEVGNSSVATALVRAENTGERRQTPRRRGSWHVRSATADLLLRFPWFEQVACSISALPLNVVIALHSNAWCVFIFLSGRQMKGRGRFIRLKVSWAGLLVLSAITARGLEACAQTHAQITGEAREMYDRVTRNWDIFLDRYIVTGSGQMPQYDAGHLAWGQADHAQVRLSRFEADRDPADLEYILDQMDLLNAHRADRLSPALVDELRGAAPAAWISFNLDRGDQAKRHAWLVHAGQTVYPAARAAALVRDDPQLLATYGHRLNAMLPDIIQTLDMFEPEYTVNPAGRGHYRDPYLEFYSGSTELPFNMQNAAGRAFISLWHATGEPRFRERAEQLARTMKDELLAVGDKYVWRYAASRGPEQAEDVVHAAINVNFMLDAYEAGLVFDEVDVQRLANTMRDMYRADEGFTKLVSGVGGADAATSDDVAEWLRLTSYDGQLRKQVYPFFKSHWLENTGDVDSVLAASYLIESGSVYEAVSTVRDSFDDPQLSRRWVRPPDQPIDHVWAAEMTGDQLQVSDLSSPRDGEWVSITRKQQVDAGGSSWEARVTFAWDSSDPDGDDLIAATQRFFVRIYDEEDSLIGKIGVNDEWDHRLGHRYARLADQREVDPPGTLAASGEAQIRIVSDRETNQTRVLWGEDALLETNQAVGISAVELEFAHLQRDGSHFGTVSLDDFYFGAILDEQSLAAELIPNVAVAAGTRRASISTLPEPSGKRLMAAGLVLLLQLRGRMNQGRR